MTNFFELRDFYTKGCDLILKIKEHREVAKKFGLEIAFLDEIREEISPKKNQASEEIFKMHGFQRGFTNIHSSWADTYNGWNIKKFCSMDSLFVQVSPFVNCSVFSTWGILLYPPDRNIEEALAWIRGVIDQAVAAAEADRNSEQEQKQETSC